MKEFNFKNIHIGQLISDLVEDRKIEESRIVKFFNNESIDLNKIYNSVSLDSYELLRWSKLLEYDLFRIYSQHLMFYAATNQYKLIPKKLDAESSIPSFKKNIYTTEMIDFIIQLIKSKRKSNSEIIEEYRIPKTTLYRWIKKYNI